MRISPLPFLLLPFCAALNAAPLTIESAIYLSKPDGTTPVQVVYSVPVVRARYAAVAARINAAFAVDATDHPIETKTIAGDTRLFLTDATTERIKRSAASLDYAIERNDARVLTIAVNGEYCGAYCETVTEYFSFDAHTGKRLTLAELFTNPGTASLGKRIAAVRLAAITGQITRLKSGEADGHPPDDAREAIAMYEYCAPFHAKPDLESGPYLRYDGLDIGPDIMTFVHERCSPHVIRALDDLGEFRTAFTLAELKPYLSDYGKDMLLGTVAQAAAAGPFSKTLHGRIGGRLAITMSLDLRAHKHVSGTYFYDRYRTPIALSGQLRGASLDLTEIGSDAVPQPTMTLTVAGDRLEGTWNGKTRLDLEAAP